jgi:exodeoxyribonuclease VII small subunit
MPKAAKASEAEPLDSLSFEEALQRLETIVEAMEAEDLPLESLLKQFAEGTGLARACQEKLAEAELKIEKLEKNSAGEMALRPLSPDLVAEQ